MRIYITGGGLTKNQFLNKFPFPTSLTKNQVLNKLPFPTSLIPLNILSEQAKLKTPIKIMINASFYLKLKYSTHDAFIQKQHPLCACYDIGI